MISRGLFQPYVSMLPSLKCSHVLSRISVKAACAGECVISQASNPTVVFFVGNTLVQVSVYGTSSNCPALMKEQHIATNGWRMPPGLFTLTSTEVSY